MRTTSIRKFRAKYLRIFTSCKNHYYGPSSSPEQFLGRIGKHSRHANKMGWLLDPECDRFLGSAWHPNLSGTPPIQSSDLYNPNSDSNHVKVPALCKLPQAVDRSRTTLGRKLTFPHSRMSLDGVQPIAAHESAAPSSTSGSPLAT